MGYGKTTALNWYLEGREREHGAAVLRLSVYSDNLRMLWRQLQNAFAGTELSEKLESVEFPAQTGSIYDMMDEVLLAPLALLVLIRRCFSWRLPREMELQLAEAYRRMGRPDDAAAHLRSAVTNGTYVRWRDVELSWDELLSMACEKPDV